MDTGIFLLLGTNLGDPVENLVTAKQNLEKHVGKIQNVSSLYKTAAWGNTDQPPFYNQVVEIQTHLKAEDLLIQILAIEHNMGRERLEKWGPRLIDIDILFYGQLIVSTTSLHIPHPGIPNRRFTLTPLAEIAPKFFHPQLKKTVITLLSECQDKLPVELVTDV